MNPTIKPISQTLPAATDRYEVVVIGSGYGGGVAASRMARAGRKVCVLERGKEILPGSYPNSLVTAAQQMQVDTPDGHTGAKTAMFDFRMNPEMNVLVGCGLGGTSLINANVALTVEDQVFEGPEKWPAPAENEQWPAVLAPFYALGRAMLNSQPYPAEKTPNKLAALEQSAKAMEQPFYRPPINVNFRHRQNPLGVEQKS